MLARHRALEQEMVRRQIEAEVQRQPTLEQARQQAWQQYKVGAVICPTSVAGENYSHFSKIRASK